MLLFGVPGLRTGEGCHDLMMKNPYKGWTIVVRLPHNHRIYLGRLWRCGISERDLRMKAWRGMNAHKTFTSNKPTTWKHELPVSPCWNCKLS